MYDITLPSNSQVVHKSTYNMNHSQQTHFDVTILVLMYRKFRYTGTNSSVLFGLRCLRKLLNIFTKNYSRTCLRSLITLISEFEVENCTCPSVANRRITRDIQMQILGCISMPQFISEQALKIYNSA